VQIAASDVVLAPVPLPVTTWRPTEELSGLVLRAGGGARRLAAALAAGGVTVLDLGDDPEAIARRLTTPGGPVAVLGEPEQWQRSWRTLQTVRSRGDLLVDAACAVEYRILTGDRMLPPYCAPGRGRAWRLRDGAGPERVVLPGEDRMVRRGAA